MILKGNQRGGGRQLALHLLNSKDNEHVHVHELRGFLADDLQSALHEAYAVSRGTRAKQFLFSLSLNPPPQEKVPTDAFEKAIEAVEAKLGLDNQPRAIVFHEKEGRRHAHVVWSRIDAGQMKAINLPFYKLKLRDISKELYFEHGWQIPRGLVDSRERDPANYTHAEWQQAKRGGHDPKALKTMFKECWAISDSGKAFAQALKSRGYYLAQGDRRGHVAVDYRGEIYAIAQYVGVRTKIVKDRLGDPVDLTSVDQVKQEIADRMTAMLQRHIKDTEAQLQKQSASFAFRKSDLIQRQRRERERLDQAQRERWVEEMRQRQQRLSSGMRGLWDRVTGKHSKIQRQNELETLQSFQRDRAEKERLIFAHIDDRKVLHQQIKAAKKEHSIEVEELHRDLAGYGDMAVKQSPKLKEHFHDLNRAQNRKPRASRRDNGFEREI